MTGLSAKRTEEMLSLWLFRKPGPGFLFLFGEDDVKLLEEKIRSDGKILGKDILKVDSFINHQIDVPFLDLLGQEFYRLYRDEKIDKILTIEASGIAIACVAARYFGVPVLFAKKSKSSNIGSELYVTEVASFTHGNVNKVVVSKNYLRKGERVLIIDDFLAEGNALYGLIDLCRQAGAEVVGCGILIEKAYQGGGERIRKLCRVESLARISKMDENGVTFV